MSVNTEKLVKSRLSEENQLFKRELEEFMKKCTLSDELIYRIKLDLKKRMNMPYYGEDIGSKARSRMYKELLVSLIEKLVVYKKSDFTEKLLRMLSEQQQQKLIRGQVKRGNRFATGLGVWEHVMPVRYFVDEIIGLINREEISSFETLFAQYTKYGQVFLSNEDDLKLARYKFTMPEIYNWRDENHDPLIRYDLCGLKNVSNKLRRTK